MARLALSSWSLLGTRGRETHQLSLTASRSGLRTRSAVAADDRASFGREIIFAG